MRMFVLDRIKMLKVTDEPFTIPKDFNVDDFMRHSFQVMHDELYTKLNAVLKETHRLTAHCQSCDEDTACYACLKTYDNQFCHHLLRRGPVIRFLDELEKHIS